MKDEKYWYQEWKNAAERSTFSEIYPQADLCWDHAASTYDLGMGNSLERVDAVSYTHLQKGRKTWIINMIYL